MTWFTSGTLYVLFLQVKPLGVIWGKFSEYYSKKNTIMFDDIGRNFLMNPQNGLKVILPGIFIYYYFFLYFKWYFLILLHCILRKDYSYLAKMCISIIFFLFRLSFVLNNISLIVVLNKLCFTIKWAFKRLPKSMKLWFLLNLYVWAIIKLGIGDKHHWNMWCSISRVVIFRK